MRLKDKVIAITGAGSGIGKAAAKLFAYEGAQVAVLEKNIERGLEVENEIKKSDGIGKFFEVDISDIESVETIFKNIEKKFGKLHVLYNNAAIFLGKKDNTVVEISPETWHKILSVNLNGMFFCSRYAIPLIIKSGGGCIINTASSAGLIGIPKCDAYTASKGAVIAMTRSMAVEFGPEKVRTNCIAPAAVYTPMVMESNLGDPDFNEKEFLTRGTPLRRWGTPEEIAKIALFLASDEASYINGAVIVADGGITIM